jgi:hypothetical protein
VPTLRVLFIGNSFTYVNNLPELVTGMAAAMTKPVTIESRQVTVGGATLRQLWRAGPAVDAIRGSRWDFVVLQEQSGLGATMVNGESLINDPSVLFWPAVRTFDAEIKRAGAKTVLLQTWGPPKGTRNYDALAHAYFTIGREIGALVIPAGLAWQRVLAARPSAPLHMADGSHPAPAGSYLTALMTVATLTGAMPTGVPLTIRGHPTGLDGRPADSVGSLAAIDSTTLRLFRRVATSVREEVARAGGYPAVRRPVMPALAPMPPARPVAPSVLGGHWKGTLRLFMGDGAPFELDISARPDGSYQATAAVQLGTVHRQDAADFTVARDELAFSIASPVDSAVRIQFRGVLAAGDRLEGRAALLSEERSWNFTGSWTVTKQQ